MSGGEPSPGGLLAGYRALDLADEKGVFCGRILGDLGADVVKVETPGGDRSRRLGPFYKDQPHPEKSLYWIFYNANKRGITLDIQTADGRELLKRLVRNADFLIESFPTGYMASLGLGYEELSKINPRLVMVSITHFGQSGPYRDYQGSDLVDMAMGGFSYILGFSDRPPLRIGVLHAYAQGGAQAAAGALTAFYYARTSGQGQHVDVSIQECIINTLNNTIQSWDITRTILKHGGMGGTRLPYFWPCKDGYVSFGVGAGTGIPANIAGMVQWMDSEGMADVAKNFDFDKMKPDEMAALPAETSRKIEEEFSRFFKAHTKKELWEGALRLRLHLFPIYSPKDLLETEHFKVRGVFQPLPHPELGDDIMFLSEFVKMPETPVSIRKRAPLIGEHNEEIFLGELGLTKEELMSLKEARVV